MESILNYVEAEPKTYYQALQAADSEKWKIAVREELDALVKNKTWKVVPREVGRKALHSKWVYKKKVDGEGKLESYKARLVACGNEQTHGKDYFDTFAPVMELTATKIILVMAQVWGVLVQ